MKLLIEIDFGNDAMLRYSQARSVIKDGLGLSDHRAKPTVGDGGTFRNVNGNRVGYWEVVADGVFVAVGHNIVRGDETVGSGRSKTMAQRMANALNEYKPGERGY